MKSRIYLRTFHENNSIFLVLTLFLVAGCVSDSPKVRKQKAIYFSVSEVPRKELEKEITRTMEAKHIDTPGKAIIYILDQDIAQLPQVDAIVNQTASQAGMQLVPQNPLEQGEDKIKTSQLIRSLRQAREDIARIEMEAGQ